MMAEVLKQGRTAMPYQMYATALRHHGRVRPLKGACLCAVCKRQVEECILLTGSGLNKMNGCDRHTGAGLKSSVVIRRCCLCEEAEAANGCGVVTAIERLGRCVGRAEQSAAPETV